MKNWSGNLDYSTSALQEAISTQEIVEIVRRSERLKVLGTRHCFNTIADSKDLFLSLAPLNKILELDAVSRTVRVEAGIRYGELATWLYERGYALHNLASLPHISIAGGCMTATHGSGMGNGNLATAVRAIEFISADGELVRMSRDKDRELFDGAVVNLGGLGVLLHLTLAVEPAFEVRQFVYEDLPMEGLEHHFDEVMSAGYSVSLFTDWRNKNINEVWVKSRVDQAAPAHGVGVFGAGVFGVELFGAKPAAENVHPIKGIGAEYCTPQMGVPGPWHERLPHFRMGFTPSSGQELQSEYFIPQEYSYRAMLAIERLHEKISPYLLISEIRCIAEDELWMSPCYRQACTAIHFTWKPDWAAVSRLLPLIEAQLAPFHAKPHWGKLFTMAPARIRASYAKLPDFRRLLGQYDLKGKFRNAFLDEIIFF
jgi:alditol oxidase